MGEELHHQTNVMMPLLDSGVDQNQRKMIKANKKLIKLLKTGSTCKLYMVILLQFVVLWLLVSY